MAISINSIKFIKSLHQKKYRQKYNNFIVEGDKIVKEILNSASFLIKGLYATEPWLETNKELLKFPNLDIFKVSVTELGRISALRTPNQVLIVAKTPESIFPSKHEEFTLYLDNIQDPGNMGTILRIADWYGIHTIFTSADTVELYNPKVIQGSMGAFLRTKVVVSSLAEIKKTYPNKKIYGAYMQGENIYTAPKTKNSILVIGNEGRGIHPQNAHLISHPITIPSGKNGRAESLNAGVATGIICSEFAKALDML